MSEGDKLFDDPDGLAGGDVGMDSSSMSSQSSTASPAPAQSRHKVACFFHVFFKAAALFLYLFMLVIFRDSFITGFICCILLLAFDFWTVKNVSGRLLVGLRWWNEVKEDGTNVWVFESKPDTRQVNPSDSFIFWSALYLTPVIWVVLGLSAIFSPHNLLIVVVAVLLSGANIVGYWKCQRDAGRRIQTFTSNWLINRMTQQATGSAAPAGQ